MLKYICGDENMFKKCEILDEKDNFLSSKVKIENSIKL